MAYIRLRLAHSSLQSNKVLFDESNYSVQEEVAITESPESLKVNRRIEDWKLRLIDLTRRNKAIYFQPTKTSHLTIVSPDMETIYNRLVERSRGWEIRQPPLTKPGEIPPKIRAQKSTEITPGWSDPNQLDRILRNLSRRAQSEYTERGIRVLFITFGQLRWTEKGNRQEIISPLLLTPVELIRNATREPYRIKIPPVEDEVIVNPALMLKLKYEHDLDLPPLPEEEEQTPSSYLLTIQKVISGLGWTVEPSVYLGIFSFSKLTIYQDLTDNLSYISEHPIVKALAGIPTDGLIQDALPRINDLDVVVDPAKMYQILDADSSQQLCIQYAIRGQSYVMHGPPGTGKSQTIANIISEYIAAGKSVLFVSEKMAALDVVYSRLKEKDLDEYCLELHSYKANKRAVIDELSRALKEHLKAGRGMSEDEIDRLRHRRTQLNTYVESLHNTRQPSNKSAYELLNEISKLESIPNIPSRYPNFSILTQKTIFSFEEQIRRLQNSWVVIEEGASFPWRGCNTATFTMEVRSDWINLLTKLIDSANQICSEAQSYCKKSGLANPKSLDDYDAIQKLANIIEASPYPPVRWLQDADLAKIQLEADTDRRVWDEYWAARSELESRYDNRFKALPMGTADILEGAWKNAAELLQPNLKGDGGLLKHFDDLIKFLDQTIRDSDGWGESIIKISEMLGLPTEPQTINWARRLHHITQLCESVNKPEKSWLDRASLEQAMKYLDKAKVQYKRREEIKEKLAAYKDELSALDLPVMITYFEGPGSSLLRYLRPSYYRVRSEISGVTKTGEIPSTILQDLKLAFELKELTKTIASEQVESKSKLGSYYREGNPDFKAAGDAMKTAKDTLRLIGASKAPKPLRDSLCIATKPSEELLNQGRMLGASLKKWRTAIRPLNILLPEKPLGDGITIPNIPFMKLKSWANELNRRLGILREVIQPAIVTAATDPKTLTQLLFDIRLAERLKNFEDEEAKLAPQRSNTYGRLYQGISTDWLKVIGAIDWTRSLLKVLPPTPPAEVISFATDPTIERPKLESERTLQEISHLIDEVNSRFSGPLWEKRVNELSVEEILLVSERLAQRIDDLQAWVDYNQSSSKLNDEGLGELVNQLVEKRYSRELLIDIYRKSIYSGLFNLFAEKDLTLGSFRTKDQDQAVDDFRSLDSVLIEESPKKVIEAANSKKPQGVFVEAPDSEITILLKEAAKKRRQMPLRHLFNRIPNLIQRLKPCLLMSPISVSQFILPERLHFDLVVFDEASQIFTEDAVGSIYRGDALIVAGDNKQLPPTPFFQYIADNDVEWEEAMDSVGAYDSVLDECMGMGLPVSMLRWHYRSKHDSLIAFSNNEFYNGKLIIFPSAIERGGGLGIEFTYVPDGVYDRGGARNNPREAEVVADIVFKQLTEEPEKSLGVMTFSISQMNTVKDVIESRLIEKPEFEKLLHEDRLRGFFVKNLENVQGDERDVMIISVGYGYDKDGSMTMNFGPLNMEGGERRLNVAVTRSREKVILVSSIKSSDIDLSSTKSFGVKCLRNYLAYAEQSSKLVEKPEEGTTTKSEIELEVAEEIRRLGYVAVPQVGESSLRVDIGVKTSENPDRFILGIILDGEGYRSTATARDRDRLRAQVLEGMGWNLHRIWSPEWVLRRSTEVERLAHALERSETSEKRSEKTQNQRTTRKKRTLEYQKVTERRSDELPGSEPYQKASIEPSHTFNNIPASQRRLYLDLYRLEVRNLLPKLVRTEGPIHIEYAYKRLNKAVKLQSASQSFHKTYLTSVNWLAERGRFEKRREFLWPNRVTNIKVRVPTEGIGAEIRPIEYISLEEIDAAMLLILSHSMGLSRESLLKETANTFKARQTPKTHEILEIELVKMIDSKKITQVGENLFDITKNSTQVS